MASHYHLFQYEIGLVEIENEVKFAHVSKIPVEHLYEVMDNIEDNELIIFLFDACNEVEGSIPVRDKWWANEYLPFEDYFVVPPF